MMDIDRHSVSRFFSHIEDSIILAHVDRLRLTKIGGDRKLVQFDETYYGNSLKVFGGICKETSEFFLLRLSRIVRLLLLMKLLDAVSMIIRCLGLMDLRLIKI